MILKGTIIKRNKPSLSPNVLPLHLMIIPALVLVIIYNYIPILGNIIAFQKFDILKGVNGILGGNEWVGLKHFSTVFKMDGFSRALFNTVNISFWKMATMFVVPLLVSLLLNEMRQEYLKKSIQTLIYLPHFLSWVILAGILKQILSTDGLINNAILIPLDMEPMFFLGDKNLFPFIVIITNIWKEFGWSTIIYLAAITSIDPSLYEAAIMDGANKLKQSWHVTLPGMKPIIVLSLVLSLGSVLNAGFEQIFNLYSVQVYDTGDILDTLVYRMSFANAQYDLATAVGLFKNTVSFVFITASYWLAYRFANYEIF